MKSGPQQYVGRSYSEQVYRIESSWAMESSKHGCLYYITWDASNQFIIRDIDPTHLALASPAIAALMSLALTVAPRRAKGIARLPIEKRGAIRISLLCPG